MTEAVDAALLDGFHAMAQPLAILQSRIESQLLSREPPDADAALFEALAAEVERLCSLLRPLQQLVTARAFCEPPCATDAWELLAPTLADFALFFANADVTFEIIPSPRALPVVSAAPDSLREMVTGMLSAAASAATVDDWVHIRFEVSDAGLTIVVANRSPRPRSIPILVQLNLALSGVRALGQGLELFVCQTPFHVRLLLPAVPPTQPS